MSVVVSPGNSMALIKQGIDDVTMGLEARKNELKTMLPAHIPVERFMRSVLIAVNKTPALAMVDRVSLFNTVNTACQLGLDVSGAFGSAWIVPFGDTASLIIGYRGWIDLINRSEDIESIEAHAVYANDEFTYELGLFKMLVHKPCIDKEQGEFRLCYAVARLKNGCSHIEVMTKAQVDAVRRRSRAPKGGPWDTDYPEMARKTVLKRAAKWLPFTSEKIGLALAHDDADTITVRADTDMQTEPGVDTSALETQASASPTARAMLNKIKG